jgi:hypothetical protein
MNGITGTFLNGQVVLDSAADWPEGCRVVVAPVPRERTLGLREEDWPTTSEGIARHLALMDHFEPVELTPEEEAAWQAARKAQKDFEKANFDKWGRMIEG